jgi:outer membrane protein OmpA-like peptidoglycan-associated protein
MRAGAGALLLALLALASCARPTPPAPAPAQTRDDLVVLLPGQDGKTGALTVGEAGAERTLDTPYAAARIKEPGRIETGVASPEEVNRVFGDALAAQPPRPVSFLLYFVEGKDELTPDSQQVLQQVFAEIARRPAPEVVVIGHTDRVGTLAYNDALSLRRAEKVRDDLVKLGIPADRIHAVGRGEREPLVPTDDEVAEPRNRRVEISVR